MWVAPCSWRTRMSLIFESTSASKIGMAAPPERPNTYSTPSRSRHWISFSAPLGSLWVPVMVFAIRSDEIGADAPHQSSKLEQFLAKRQVKCGLDRQDGDPRRGSVTGWGLETPSFVIRTKGHAPPASPAQHEVTGAARDRHF